MATQNQALVSGALQELKLEFVEGGAPGSPPRMKVTKATVEYVKSLEGKTLVVDGDGNVTAE